MNTIDRRGVIRVFAAGAACVAGSASVAAGPSPPARVVVDAEAPILVGLAEVTRCRSTGGDIYLRFDHRIAGAVCVDARAFAVAAACQAAGRLVAAQVWGHEPRADAGAGRFAGALLAVELADLPGCTTDPT